MCYRKLLRILIAFSAFSLSATPLAPQTIIQLNQVTTLWHGLPTKNPHEMFIYANVMNYVIISTQETPGTHYLNESHINQVSYL